MTRRYVGILAMIVVMLSQLAAFPVGAGAQATNLTTYTSPTFGYSLSYDPSWELVDTSVTAERDRLVLKQGTGYVMIDGTTYFGGEVSSCVDGIAEAMILNGKGYSDVSLATNNDGQPLQYADATQAYAVYHYTYTYDSGKTEAFTDLVQCVPLVAGESVVAFFLSVPAMDYNASLPDFDALVAGLTLPTATTVQESAECPDEQTVPGGSSGRIRITGSASTTEQCVEESSEGAEDGASPASEVASQEEAQPEPHPAAIVTGTCDASGQLVFALAPVSSTLITTTAADVRRSAELGTTILDVSLAEIVAGGYVIAINDSGSGGKVVACGELETFGSQAGAPVDQLKIGLIGPEAMGIAWLWANADGTTTVNVFLTATAAAE